MNVIQFTEEFTPMPFTVVQTKSCTTRVLLTRVYSYSLPWRISPPAFFFAQCFILSVTYQKPARIRVCRFQRSIPVLIIKFIDTAIQDTTQDKLWWPFHIQFAFCHGTNSHTSAQVCYDEYGMVVAHCRCLVVTQGAAATQH
jgi:hypothetical protein